VIPGFEKLTFKSEELFKPTIYQPNHSKYTREELYRFGDLKSSTVKRNVVIFLTEK